MKNLLNEKLTKKTL
jgi:hypothetical protein